MAVVVEEVVDEVVEDVVDDVVEEVVEEVLEEVLEDVLEDVLVDDDVELEVVDDDEVLDVGAPAPIDFTSASTVATLAIWPEAYGVLYCSQTYPVKTCPMIKLLIGHCTWKLAFVSCGIVTETLVKRAGGDELFVQAIPVTVAVANAAWPMLIERSPLPASAGGVQT